VRLGGEARGLDGARPATGRRAGYPLPRGLGQEQHQRREGLLQPRERHQEAAQRHGQVGGCHVRRGQRGGSRDHGVGHGREVLLAWLLESAFFAWASGCKLERPTGSEGGWKKCKAAACLFSYRCKVRAGPEEAEQRGNGAPCLHFEPVFRVGHFPVFTRAGSTVRHGYMAPLIQRCFAFHTQAPLLNVLLHRHFVVYFP
jgi:hypothetical protein